MWPLIARVACFTNNAVVSAGLLALESGLAKRSDKDQDAAIRGPKPAFYTLSDDFLQGDGRI